MSQHQLFHQLPDFLLGHPADSDSTRSNAGDPEQNDVDCTSELRIPSYNLGRRLQPPNAWIGTRGTVTTLHSDTSDGFLCQVAGYKYVRLYGALDRSPGGRDETHLYAQLFREGEKWFGTSPVRIEIPDFDKHPNFAAVADQYTEALLEPGDMLYIPEGHWHYIRSLTTSVSINFGEVGSWRRLPQRVNKLYLSWKVETPPQIRIRLHTKPLERHRTPFN